MTKRWVVLVALVALLVLPVSCGTVPSAVKTQIEFVALEVDTARKEIGKAETDAAKLKRALKSLERIQPHTTDLRKFARGEETTKK